MSREQRIGKGSITDNLIFVILVNFPNAIEIKTALTIHLGSFHVNA